MLLSTSRVLNIFLLCLICGQVAQAQTLHLQKRAIYDSGFGQRMASHTVLVPANWSMEGHGYWHGSQLYNNVPSQTISMRSPDGVELQIGPIINASDGRITSTGRANGFTRPADLTAFEGRLVLTRPESLGDWRQLYESTLMPLLESGSNAELTKVFEIPELTALVEHHLGSTRQELASSRNTLSQMNIHQSCDGMAVGFRTRYQENGRQMESLHVLLIASVSTQTPDYLRIDWNSVADVRLAAPVGQLEKMIPQMVMIAGSVRETPQWAQQKATHLAKMHNDTIQTIAAISRINAQTSRDINNIINQTYQNTTRINDRSHARYINAIREVEVYNNGGYNYELPSGYDRVYGDGFGNFVLTNDHLFNPNVDLDSNSNWSEVNPAR